MANPKELREAAEAIRDVRRMPAVQRHQQLEDLLRQAEEWARKEYCKVSEKKNDQNDPVPMGPPHSLNWNNDLPIVRHGDATGARCQGWLMLRIHKERTQITCNEAIRLSALCRPNRSTLSVLH